jgi:hypothetical protein
MLSRLLVGRMSSKSTDVNLAYRAKEGNLTVEEVNAATKDKLETDKNKYGNTTLFLASFGCGIEVVEAIINKGVDVNQLSGPVSIIIICYLFGLN